MRAVFRLRGISVNRWLGRSAHINCIDDEAFVMKFAAAVERFFAV